jgi:hypothetical protein
MEANYEEIESEEDFARMEAEKEDREQQKINL